MAICSGCSSAACNCVLTVLDTPSLNLTLTGTGAAATPWVLSGVAAGGSCAQKNVYTVSTVGPAGFGGVGTPEPFLSCADFMGDGINDQLAIQAAVEAAFNSGGSFITSSAKVVILPGLYQIQAPIDTKGVSVEGVPNGGNRSGSVRNDYSDTLLFDSAIGGGPGGVRFFHNTFIIPGTTNPGGLRLRHLSMFPGGAVGAAAIKATLSIFRVDIQECGIFPTPGHGADGGFIDLTGVSDVVIKNVLINDNFIGGVTGINIDTPVVNYRTVISECNIVARANSIRIVGGSLLFGSHSINNNILQGPVSVGNLLARQSDVTISDNVIKLPSTLSTGNAINLLGVSDFVISGNVLRSRTNHCVRVEGVPAAIVVSGLISNNIIKEWDSTDSSSFDGIHMTGNVERVFIQGNQFFNTNDFRFEINLATSTCLRNRIGNNHFQFSSTRTGIINDLGIETFKDLGGHFIRKTANETVTSSTVLQNDNHFNFFIQSREIWELDFTIFYDGDTAGDIQFGLSVPALAVVRMGLVSLGVAAAGDTFDMRSISYTAGGNTVGAAGAGTVLMASFKAIVVNDTASGNVILQWAQGTSSATATTVFANSYMKAQLVT